jgi:hypothetical protein
VRRARALRDAVRDGWDGDAVPAALLGAPQELTLWWVGSTTRKVLDDRLLPAGPDGWRPAGSGLVGLEVGTGDRCGFAGGDGPAQLVGVDLVLEGGVEQLGQPGRGAQVGAARGVFGLTECDPDTGGVIGEVVMHGGHGQYVGAGGSAQLCSDARPDTRGCCVVSRPEPQQRVTQGGLATLLSPECGLTS